VVKLSTMRTTLSDYLKSKMDVVAPNLRALIGETVGACGFWHLSLANPAKTLRKTGPGGFGNLGPGLVGTGMNRSFEYRGFISIHI
jgi:hypothetical protein